MAFSPDLGYVEVDDGVAAEVARAAAAFEELAADVEQVDPGFDDPRDAFEVIWSAGAARAIADLGDAPGACSTRASPRWRPSAARTRSSSTWLGCR